MAKEKRKNCESVLRAKQNQQERGAISRRISRRAEPAAESSLQSDHDSSIGMILRLAWAAALASPVVIKAAHKQPPAFQTRSLAGKGNCNRYPCWASPFCPPRLCSPRLSARKKHQPTYGNRMRKSCNRLEMMVATRDSALPAIDSPAGAALANEGLKPREWAALLKEGELMSLQQEELLISQGDIYENPGDREVYLLLDGECRIEVKGQAVGEMGPGEFVGEGETLWMSRGAQDAALIWNN